MRQMNLGGKPEAELQLVPINPEDVHVGLKVYSKRYHQEATVVEVSGNKVHLEHKIYASGPDDDRTEVSPFDIEYVTRGHLADAKQIEQLGTQALVAKFKGICGVSCDSAEENFVERISALMQRNHWSAEMVGEQIGIEKARLSDVLGGRSLPTLTELVEFSSVFGYSIDDLLK